MLKDKFKIFLHIIKLHTIMSSKDIWRLLVKRRQRKMDRAKISSRWQVVIPKRIRKAMGLEIGGALAFKFEGDHAVVFGLDRDPIKALYGRYKGKNLLEELEREREWELEMEEKGMKQPDVRNRDGG